MDCRQILVPVATAVLLAGCAVPESRLRTGLTRAGLSPPLAACMAGRMVDRLSLPQLLRIADLPRLPRAGERQPIGAVLHRLRALGDPEIVGVSASSAALCATGLAR